MKVAWSDNAWHRWYTAPLYFYAGSSSGSEAPSQNPTYPDPNGNTPDPGQLAIETDTGIEYVWTGAAWKAVSTSGQRKVRIAGSDLKVYGSALFQYLIGTLEQKVALPSGSGLGPDTFVVDLRDYDAAAIYVAALTTSTNHTATVVWSPDGQSANTHPAAAVSLWSAASGNNSAKIDRRDAFAHITLSQSGTAADVVAYVTGRELG